MAGVKPIVISVGLASLVAHKLTPLPRVRHNHFAVRSYLAFVLAKSPEQVLIRQAVKSVTSRPGVFHICGAGPIAGLDAANL